MHADINERGEDEYHAYVVEKAEDYIGGTFNPAVILQTLGDTVYFGTVNGDLCAFNFDKRNSITSFIPPEYYTFNNRIIFSGCATKMDNCGIPHLTKSTEKKSTVVKLQTFDSTAAKLKVRTNREPYKQVARINAARTDFESMNFMDIPFQTEGKGIFSVKEKKKSGWKSSISSIQTNLKNLLRCFMPRTDITWQGVIRAKRRFTLYANRNKRNKTTF
jgi:hypothetical protein